jgi:hypothetical protein
VEKEILLLLMIVVIFVVVAIVPGMEPRAWHRLGKDHY